MTSSNASRNRREQLVADALARAGYKLTGPRMKVIACLLDGQHAHTVEEISRHIEADQSAKPNLRSVYSVLNLLVELNLVHDYFVAGKHRFELTAGQADHIHLLVDESDTLATLPISPALNEALHKAAADAGYAIKDVQVVMHVQAKRG